MITWVGWRRHTPYIEGSNMSMHHVILVLEQPLIPVQAEMELKKGQDNKKALFYFDKAVELNDYDETALVARSRQGN